jgi:hypothetical protein
MQINRKWAIPSSDTFDVPPIGEFVKSYLRQAKVSVDPFARNKRWATYTNDLNPNTEAEYHLDVADFLKILVEKEVKADLVIFDPPYSPRQVKEMYSGFGKPVSRAIKTNAKETDFSIEGLAAASVEYLGLASAQERAQFAQEKYGKSWAQIAKLLEKGSDQVRAMAAAVDEGHLFNEDDLRDIEAYRMQVDELADSQEALAISTGRVLMPVQKDFMDFTKILIDTLSGEPPLLEYATLKSLEHRAATDIATQSYIAWGRSIEASSLAMEDAGESAEALGVDYGKLISSIRDMQSESDRYKETQGEVAEKETELLATKDELLAKIETLKTRGYQEMGQTIQDVRQDIQDVDDELQNNKDALAENEEAHRKWAAQTVLSFAQARAAADGNISQGEGQIIIDMGVQLGVFDQQTATAMENVNKAFDNVNTENAQQTIDAMREALEALTGKTWDVNVVTNYINQGVPPTVAENYIPQAIGGPQEAGQPYLVHQDEIIVPSQNGYTLTRTDARQILANAAGGGGGKSIVIQNLTIYARGTVMDVLEELG